MSRTEDNNKYKELCSRPQIVTVINRYVPGPKLMFEFLGEGIGAKYYEENVEDLKLLTLCESNKEKRERWLKDVGFEKFPLCRGIIWEDAMDLFTLAGKWNVINLDFCTFFYDNGKDNCSAAIINKVFEKRRLLDNGLLLVTFSITGIGVNMYKGAIKDPDEICKAISCIAEKNGYSVELVHKYSYKASKPTTMLNLVFQGKIKK